MHFQAMLRVFENSKHYEKRYARMGENKMNRSDQGYCYTTEQIEHYYYFNYISFTIVKYKN